MKTAMNKMLEYLNGLLKIEDNLIKQYGDLPKAVEDIKTNWQQLNNIKEMAITLSKNEEEQIISAYDDGWGKGFDKNFTEGEKYYTNTFNQK